MPTETLSRDGYQTGIGTDGTMYIAIDTTSVSDATTYNGVAVSAPNSVTLTLTDHLAKAGDEGDWEMIDAISPVMTEGARARPCSPART